MSIRKNIKGVSLIELIFAVLIGIVVFAFIYRYWIKGVQEMSTASKRAALTSNLRKAFNSVSEDLKMIGYNPRLKTDPNYYFHPFGIIQSDSSEIDPPRYEPEWKRPFNQLTFSFYNEKSDNKYTPDSEICSDSYCTRIDYYLKDAKLFKRYWNPVSIPQKRETMLVLNNCCTQFVLWDIENNEACHCQDGFSCRNTSHISLPPCALDERSSLPKTIKLILAVADDEESAKLFRISSEGCSDSNPSTPCCDIIGSKTAKGMKTEYIKMEKVIRLVEFKIIAV